MSPLPAGGRCATHPEAAAVEVCSRCGGFTCAACLQLDEQEPHAATCAACHAREGATGPSGRAVAALVAGVVSVSLCPPLGFIAWILGEHELDAIERGASPRRGLNLARGARILGMLTVALTAIGLLGALAFGVLVYAKSR